MGSPRGDGAAPPPQPPAGLGGVSASSDGAHSAGWGSQPGGSPGCRCPRSLQPRVTQGWPRWHGGCPVRCPGGVCSPRGWRRWVEAEQPHPGPSISTLAALPAAPRGFGSSREVEQPRTWPGSPLLARGAHLCLCRALGAGRAELSLFLHLSPGPGSPALPQAHPGTGNSHEGRAWSRIPAEPCPARLDVPVLLGAGEGRAGAGGWQRFPGQWRL